MTHISIGDCEICSQLDEVETSFEKWGWEEQTRRLPPAAGRLIPVDALDSYDAERHHVERCPICGTFYRYDWTYEYLSNGSEDEETLTRLTPTEARQYLADGEYEALIAALRADLDASDERSRRYAARALADIPFAGREVKEDIP